MIRPTRPDDFDQVLEVINDGAVAYAGKIPASDGPYMPAAELRAELAAGVVFWAYELDGKIAAVMGLQHVADVTLIRHAYTGTAYQHRGLGSALLEHLRAETQRPLLVGTWRAAAWAVRFYERHGFRLVPQTETAALLRRYWTVPEWQIEASVVLGDERWFATAGG